MSDGDVCINCGEHTADGDVCGACWLNGVKGFEHDECSACGQRLTYFCFGCRKLIEVDDRQMHFCDPLEKKVFEKVLARQGIIL